MKKKLYILSLLSLTLTSCNHDEIVKDDLYNEMKSYVYSRAKDVYGFEEIDRTSQKATKLSRDSDIYILQDELKGAVNQRLALVAHTYFVHNAGSYLNKEKSLLEIEGKDLKVCPNPKYADLYLTQEEIDYANKIYYSSIPGQLEKIKEMESRNFNGFRHYYACQYRKKLSDRIITKQFVVYENNKEYEVFELKYDYDLLRSYIKAISSVDLNDPYVIHVSKMEGGWGSKDIYRNIFNRLSIDILDYSAISGY